MAIVNRAEIYPSIIDDFASIVRVHVKTYDEQGRPLVVKSVEMEPLAGGELWREPPFSMDREATQALMDRLWQIGFRPTEGTGSAGALAATQKHLEDMRKIAFQLLERHA